MGNRIAFIKENKGKLGWITICLILLSVSGTLLLPHFMIQWSHDRPFGTLHILVGMLTGIAGIIGMILLFRSVAIREKKNWKKELGTTFITYFVLQLLMGFFLGILGVGLHRITKISYDMTKHILYMVTQILQNIIRIVVLFFLMERMYQKCWKDDKAILIKGGLVALTLSIINLLIVFIPMEAFMVILQSIWQIIYILFFIVYFLEMQKRSGGVKE